MDDAPVPTNEAPRGRIEEWKLFFFRYERRISSAALVFGFIFDNIMFSRIDVEFAALGLLAYLAVAGLGILLINLQEKEGWGGWLYSKTRPILPPVVQFAFGALFSGFVIFYTRSGSLAASWPFFLLLASILIGNEFFRSRYVRMAFQTGIFFIALFSLSIFFLPIVVGEIGAWVFVASGIISLVLIILFMRLLAQLAPMRFEASRRFMYVAAGSIFIGMNVLYFTNIIPPIPLSLRDAGIYHSVTRVAADEYRVVNEVRPWYDAFIPGIDVHVVPGESVYAYTSIFAPTDINTRIVHQWQRQNETTGEWVTESTVGFPISGGRDSGYRGYTIKNSIEEGKWRVDVETVRGQLLGRLSFEVIYVPAPVPVEELQR